MNSDERYTLFEEWMGKRKNYRNRRFRAKVPGNYASRLKNKGFLVEWAKAQLAGNVFEIDNPRIVLALRTIMDEMATNIPAGQKADYADLKVALKWYEKFLHYLKQNH